MMHFGLGQASLLFAARKNVDQTDFIGQ